MQNRILPAQALPHPPTKVDRQNPPNLQEFQETIYQFLIDLVNRYSPETVLIEFNRLFVFGENTLNSEANKAIYEIIFHKDEQEFSNTLKRACYILINNWSARRNNKYIQELIETLGEVKDRPQTLSASLSRLRTWLTKFIESENYQELRLFALPYTGNERGNWTNRYAFYLLVPQYLNSDNPIEQRDLASQMAKRLKEKFKFDLAMYTVRCNSPTAKDELIRNPTRLGKGVIRLLQQLISKNFLFNYTNCARIFLQQTQDLNYQEFKESLLKYLLYAERNSADQIKEPLAKKLANLYQNRHQDRIDFDLLLRTCRRTIEFMTTEDGKKPSSLFILLASQGNPLTIVITLLKIILLCNYVRTHLDVSLGKLIQYYESYPEKECQWFINFLDIFNVVLAIYTENIEYNLVQVKGQNSDDKDPSSSDKYRIFCQLKGANLRGTNLTGADIRSKDLSAADLRGANISSANLSQADLSLAKLSQANLSSGLLNGANLTATDLSGANLHGANLSRANLNRATLQKANLNRANLVEAMLHYTNLQEADLSYANLSHAILNGCNLKNADLRYATLQQVDLSQANLSRANLSGANLSGANLTRVKMINVHLNQANLDCAVMTRGDLCGAELNGAVMRRINLISGSAINASLRDADLSHADLSSVNLSGSDLTGALLRHVNLKNADLSYANLTGANLFNTNLSGANVKGTQFRNNVGFSEAKQRDLEQRGAIFESSYFTL
ncbi:MAG TPA: hypothetical protein DEG17_22190 [Cyanobacteria bacterium UBA11149]|nr:hypothetical protein [Cyanobacteria bacterium UBA11366]HBK63343.1 hypothetical protein [Cyanobacteria bacterium UBA11166]HBR72705.1 hypothetical protein [Cyanobacteria bacterium UBA11159]HBS68327.1 hypothetical protein [Cyanobacteria bacterium UBA11153]HBW91493.1 hypothetical protein [Cyanobacteria bacterium UBA11149]HCA95948.1 hypothetical protein [Cyanobacteria bacterium UBA9226]